MTVTAGTAQEQVRQEMAELERAEYMLLVRPPLAVDVDTYAEYSVSSAAVVHVAAPVKTFDRRAVAAFREAVASVRDGKLERHSHSIGLADSFVGYVGMSAAVSPLMIAAPLFVADPEKPFDCHAVVLFVVPQQQAELVPIG